MSEEDNHFNSDNYSSQNTSGFWGNNYDYRLEEDIPYYTPTLTETATGTFVLTCPCCRRPRHIRVRASGENIIVGDTTGASAAEWLLVFEKIAGLATVSVDRRINKIGHCYIIARTAILQIGGSQGPHLQALKLKRKELITQLEQEQPAQQQL